MFVICLLKCINIYYILYILYIRTAIRLQYGVTQSRKPKDLEPNSLSAPLLEGQPSFRKCRGRKI